MTNCAICGKPCPLEGCVTDEEGRAVHAHCYYKRVTPVHQGNYDQVEELLQQAQELRETADRLIKKSDMLIAAYMQLTGQTPRQKNPEN